MFDYTINLKPVYSQTIPTPEGIKLPDGWKLRRHQLETLQALRDTNLDILFHYAMTGDGKSLAAYLETMQTNCCAIGLYPTNELSRDQKTQIQGYIEQFHPEFEPRIHQLSGQELEIYAENEKLKKSSAIASRAGNSEILLTNPDIFHYLHQGAYLTPEDSPDKLWGRIDKDFDLFIFDEFHVFSAPQIASVINILLLIRHTNRRKKFLFLSATPNHQLMDRLQQVGFRCREINPNQANYYQFPDTLKEKEKLSSQDWQEILHSTTLNFIPLESTSAASEIWLKENSDVILQHFQKHPGSKGAIILNSIAAVKRLTPFFRHLLEPHGLTVGENTGLSGKTEKLQSLNADLVLGTSTIDVGVDFKINFLFFESADSGTFIQRLGRLGRHDRYQRHDQIIQFQNFTAYALTPNFLVERLFQGENPPLVDQENYDRPFFHNQIYAHYRKINDFEKYYQRWGAVQSVKLWKQLSSKTIKSVYSKSQKAFQTDCEIVFDTSLKKVIGRIYGWQKDWQQLSGQKNGNPIAEDAYSFRGSSSLQCGLYDLTESQEIDRFKTYSLPGILSNLEIEMIPEAGFMRLLRETAEKYQTPIAKGHFKHCLGFMKLQGYRQERLNWKFTYPGRLQEIGDRWKVQVLTGIEVWQPENYWCREINRQLKKQALVCYVLRHPVAEVKMRLRLPMHFQIYPISDQASIHDPTPPYSIAFGQSALLLDTLAYSLKGKGGEDWII